MIDRLTSPLRDYLCRELKKSKKIKKECYSEVMLHLEHKINLNKTGNKLSATEKKELGINARLSISHELVAVLNEEGLRVKDPKWVLTKH